MRTGRGAVDRVGNRSGGYAASAITDAQPTLIPGSSTSAKPLPSRA